MITPERLYSVMTLVIVDVSGTMIVVWAVLVLGSTSVVWDTVVLVTVFRTVFWTFLRGSVRKGIHRLEILLTSQPSRIQSVSQ